MNDDLNDATARLEVKFEHLMSRFDQILANQERMIGQLEVGRMLILNELKEIKLNLELLVYGDELDDSEPDSERFNQAYQIIDRMNKSKEREKGNTDGKSTR